ncbi:hypothetical protein ABVN23_19700 [Pseudomonas fluorescens]|uniref:hypothetical protein n=1 Tax=Pseudomonas fluorescens TaxID=294 RepID=UPI003F953534
MSVSLADKIFLTAGLLDFGGIFIWIGINLHLAYTKMDYMLEHLKNCSLIKTLTPLNQGGPWGKFLLVGGISGVLTFPGMYIKRGNADADDIKNFPALLKRKLVVLHWVCITLLIGLFTLFILRKSGILK